MSQWYPPGKEYGSWRNFSKGRSPSMASLVVISSSSLGTGCVDQNSYDFLSVESLTSYKRGFISDSLSTHLISLQKHKYIGSFKRDYWEMDYFVSSNFALCHDIDSFTYKLFQRSICQYKTQFLPKPLN